MKKYLLVLIALLLTGAVVMATVLTSQKKKITKTEAKKTCPYKKTRCSPTSYAACY